MRRHALSTIEFFLCALALGATSIAAAQEAGPTSAPVAREHELEREARALFQLAHAHYDAGRYAEAVVELERAYELSHRAEILLDVHLAYRELGDAEHGADALRRYLAASTSLDDETRVVLERRLVAMEQTAAQRRAARAAEVPATPPAEVPAPAGSTREPDEGPLPASPSPGAPLLEAREADEPVDLDAARTTASSELPWPAIAGWSVGGAGLLLTVIAGPAALATRDGLACSPVCSDAELGSTRALGTAADVGLVVAALGAATGTVLYFVVPTGSASSLALGASPAPGGATVTLGGVL